MIKLLFLLSTVILSLTVSSFGQAVYSPGELANLPEAERRAANMRAEGQSRRDSRDADRTQWARGGVGVDGRFPIAFTANTPPSHLSRYTAAAMDGILKKREINPEDIESYEKFLKQKGTGIFRIFPDADCVRGNKIFIDGDCKYHVLESTAFSFRWGMYDRPAYADISYYKGRLISRGFYSFDMMTSIGNIPLENIVDTELAVKQMLEFSPATNIEAARADISKYDNGIEIGGVKWATEVGVSFKETYLLRAVSYNLNRPGGLKGRSFKVQEIPFYYLGQDIRSDTSIAFRIVRMSPDGGLTILWKEIKTSVAPILNIEKNVPLKDLR